MNSFPPLNLPPAHLNIKNEGGKVTVLCQCRRRRLVLTPEEWVRQNFISYLVNGLGYPQGLVAAEKSVDVNGLPQRADVVVYDRNMSPIMIVECKAPHVTICQATLNQALRYFSQLGSRALVLTNGLSHFCVAPTSAGGFAFVKGIPVWQDLVGDAPLA